jgi:hypothetical protein
MVFSNIMHPPEIDSNFIPHQIHLTGDKVKKMLKGLPVILPFSHMGSGVGHHVVMLKPQNARKLLTAYKKGKGMKLHLHPDELHHTIHHGMGFFDMAKKLYHGVKETVKKALHNPAVNDMAQQGVRYGADALGTAVGTYFGNPVAGAMVGDVIGRAGANAIKRGEIDTGTLHNEVYGPLKSQAKEIAFDAIHNKIHDLPKEYQGVAKEALQGAFDVSKSKKNTNYEGFGIKRKGGKLKKGSAEAKAFMASIRKKKHGGAINWDPLHLGDKLRDFGHTIEDKVIHPAEAKIKQTFTPSNIMSGLKTAGHYLIPATTGALGGIAGDFVGGPLGGIAGSAGGSYLGKKIDEKLGIGLGLKRMRGRPKKGGDLASMSRAYKQALRNNFNGLTLSNEVINNAPVGNYQINPKVKPSSTEMTLSPYQGINSPAMNPFVPTNYAQMGGTSSGYGGHGLQHTIFGHAHHMMQPFHGVGLYGGGKLSKRMYI